MRFVSYAALALLASCSPAFAQTTNCAPTEAIYQKLEEFKEQRMFVGYVQSAIVELWVNPDSETWTLLVTRPDGISCAPAVGVGWESIPIVSGDPA